MTTRLYLCVNKQTVTLTDDMTDPNTVFKLRPIREVYQRHDNGNDNDNDDYQNIEQTF